MSRKNAPLTALLAATLVGVYGLELALGGSSVCAAYGFEPAHPTLGTAVSSMFLHDPDHLLHLGGNLVFLVVFGTVVEKALGSARFLILYLAAGLGGCALHAFVNYGSTTPLVGASGALFGLLALVGTLRSRFLGFVLAFVGVEIWHAFSGAAGSVSFSCHIGGFVVGAFAAMLLQAFNGVSETVS
jgi:membrane associated rhomboid family serine protease